MLLLTLNLQQGVYRYSKQRKKRFYAEIGGMRMLFATAQDARRAQEAESPREIAAAAIKKAAVRTAKPVIQAAPVVAHVLAHDDEDDIELILIAI